MLVSYKLFCESQVWISIFLKAMTLARSKQLMPEATESCEHARKHIST